MSNSIKLPLRLPLLIIDGVLFPGATILIPVTSYRNLNMIKSHILNRSSFTSTIIGVVPKEIRKENSKDNHEEEKTNLHHIGTAGIVVQATGTNWPRPVYTLLVTGLCRFRLDSLAQESPYLLGCVKQLDKLPIDYPLQKNNEELNELITKFREQSIRFIEILDLTDPVIISLKKSFDSDFIENLPDILAAIIKASFQERLEILDAVDLTERFRKILPLLSRQIESIQKSRKKNNTSLNPSVIPFHTGISPLRKHQRVDFDDEESDDADDLSLLERKIKNSELPNYAKKIAIKEFKRLKKMPTHMPEHAMTRTYLELVTDLPWSKISCEVIDLDKSKHNLDNDHYGLEKLKRRVLEYIAVRVLKSSSLRGPILCFVGPPGVGKTSVARSIAKSLGREFHRISLGGICDQADIRGHRRTYIGSMPGLIIQGLKSVGVKNPVFLMDEIDKMKFGIHGDPAAALLEVLDPEQNYSFTDHYLNVPFDLSQVLFIATANTTSTIPPALLDRMEIINISGYTHEEKLKIAKNYLIPKQLEDHGLKSEYIQFTDDTLKILISKYTREAGVRNLERKISAICRALVVKIVEQANHNSNLLLLNEENTIIRSMDIDNHESSKNLLPSSNAVNICHLNLPLIVDIDALENILGPPLFETLMPSSLGIPGVAVSLAWTSIGGEIMFVEAGKMEGDGQLTLTGQLGKVMKESAKIALNWVRTYAHKYGIPVVNGKDLMDNYDIHIHFPAGAVGKDGPSAGIAIVTALVSLFTEKIVCSDIAMTGEITLSGLILPVGGIKAKILAAHRSGIKRVILPKKNEKDLLEINSNTKNDMIFHLVNTIDEVLNLVFENEENLSSFANNSKILQISSKL